MTSPGLSQSTISYSSLVFGPFELFIYYETSVHMNSQQRWKIWGV